jgi:hypothetical protein
MTTESLRDRTDRQSKLVTEMNERLESAKEEIVATLEGLGHNVNLYGEIIDSIDGIRICYETKFESMSGSGWYRNYNGKCRITVGSWSDKTSYPEGKNGFNIEKIVQKLLQTVDSENRRITTVAADAKRTEATKDFFEMVSENVHPDHTYYSEIIVGRASIRPSTPEKVAVTVNVNLDELKALLAVINEKK